MQSIYDLYQADRHNDVVSLYLSSDWRPQVDSDKIFIVAASYFKIGEYSESYQLLKSIQSSFSDDINFLSLHAAACRKVGQLSESKSIFSCALKIAPDDIRLLNNYSNLLIDLKRYDDAYAILHDLVLKNPDYEDAVANYNRLQQVRSLSLVSASHDSASALSPKNLDKFSTEYSSTQTSSSQTSSSTRYFDPLLFAFTEDEVKRTAPFRPSTSVDIKSGTLKDLKNSFPSQDLNAVAADQLNLAIRAVSDNNPSFALQTCSHALLGLEKNPELYSCVADAYLSQKNFLMAELYYLHSIALGSSSFKNNFNLASLACMKRDYGLSEYYLGVANSIDRSNNLVKNLKKQITDHRSRSCSEDQFTFTNNSPYDQNVSES